MSSCLQSSEAIEPAADALIQEHGAYASSEAARQVRAVVSNGFYFLAATWQQIRLKIVERQQAEDHTWLRVDPLTLSDQFPRSTDFKVLLLPCCGGAFLPFGISLPGGNPVAPQTCC
jgi:hypothetical protein